MISPNNEETTTDFNSDGQQLHTYQQKFLFHLIQTLNDN